MYETQRGSGRDGCVSLKLGVKPLLTCGLLHCGKVRTACGSKWLKWAAGQLMYFCIAQRKSYAFPSLPYKLWRLRRSYPKSDGRIAPLQGATAYSHDRRVSPYAIKFVPFRDRLYPSLKGTELIARGETPGKLAGKTRP